MNPMRFVIRRASNNGLLGYRVHYEDRKNGKTIFRTQVYNDIRDAYRAIELAKLYAATAPVVDQSRAARAS
jgi:uncharacterized protein YegP (UPF0339 family)